MSSLINWIYDSAAKWFSGNQTPHHQINGMDVSGDKGPSSSRRGAVQWNQPYKFKPFTVNELNLDQLDPNQVPKPRSGQRTVTDRDGMVYCFGGFNPDENLNRDPVLRNDPVWLRSRPLFQDLWQFNPYTRRWKRLPTSDQMPAEVASHCAILVGNELMVVYGGSGVPFGHRSSNQIHTCNLKTGKWSHMHVDVAASQMPLEQYGQALTIDRETGQMYVVGGTTGFQYTIDVHRYDPVSRIWTELYKKMDMDDNSFPQPRYRHEIVYYKHKLYVFGGGTALQCHEFNPVPVFDLQKNSWSQLKTKPDPTVNWNEGYPLKRRCHQLVQIGTKVFIIGGTSGPKVFRSIWSFDLETLEWKKLDTKLPIRVFFHSASVSPEGQLTVFGGVEDPENSHRTNTTCTIWLRIPSLKEMAFESALHYLGPSRLKSLSREELIKIGIPGKMIGRIKSEEDMDTSLHAPIPPPS